MQLAVTALLALAASLAAGPLAAQRTDSMTASPAERIGGGRASIVIEEYSDFQCPFCAAYEMKYADAMQRWVEAQNGAVRFEFYDLALPQHAHAAVAAQAARCAGRQHRYAQARHAIFEAQQQWAMALDGAQRVTELARGLVKDTASFNTCLSRDALRVERTLTANLERARELGVPGTPTFLVFVGERVAQVVDPASPDSMAAVIRSLQAKP